MDPVTRLLLWSWHLSESSSFYHRADRSVKPYPESCKPFTSSLVPGSVALLGRGQGPGGLGAEVPELVVHLKRDEVSNMNSPADLHSDPNECLRGGMQPTLRFLSGFPFDYGVTE